MEKATNLKPAKLTADDIKSRVAAIRRDNLTKFFSGGPMPKDKKSYLSQLINGTAPFGEKAARNLEITYNMGIGYLDRDPNSQPEDGPVRSVEPSTMATLATSIVQTTLLMAGLPKNLLGDESELRATILQRKVKPKGITDDQVRQAFVEKWVEEAEYLEVMAGSRGNGDESTEDVRRRMGLKAAETLLKKIKEL